MNLVGTDVIGLKEQVMVVGMIAWAVVGGIGAVIMIIVTIGVLRTLLSDCSRAQCVQISTHSISTLIRRLRMRSTK